MKLGVRQPPAKAFMDDLTIATTHTIQTRWILGGLEALIRLVRMKFNAMKMSSVVLNGKPSEWF